MTPCLLKEYQSLTILKEKDVAGGTYERVLTYQGNSLLGTIVIDRLDSGSVDVEFYEIIDQTEHLRDSFNFAGVGAHDLVVLPFHSKMSARITTTDVSSFTLKMTARNDQIDIAPGGTVTGEAFYTDGVEVSTPTIEQTLTSFTVAAGKTHLLSKIKVSCFRAGTWIAYADSDIIGSGRTGGGQPDSTLSYIPVRKLSSSQTFELKFSALVGKASDVHFHVMGTEF